MMPTNSQSIGYNIKNRIKSIFLNFDIQMIAIPINTKL